MERLGAYKLAGALSNQNAGYSVWGFGKKNGESYFLKQFMTPKYPANDTASSPERVQRKLKECERFEQKKVAIYKALNEHSDGNAVRVEEFFRIDSKYYISMRRMEALPWDIAAVAALPSGEIRRLCAIIAHGVDSFHRGRIVHSDLKHDNVLFVKTERGNITAKVIDFDSSFLETDPPLADDEIIGDLVYFSPEACRSIWGEEMKLTCKMDIFALGVLFHQYFSGELPGFDTEESTYPGEAVAKGELLAVSSKVPTDVYELLGDMLNPDPERRPAAMEVFHKLRGTVAIDTKREEDGIPAAPDEEETISLAINPSTLRENPFYRAGNL